MLAKVPKRIFRLRNILSENARRWDWKKPSFKESVAAH